ncbi:hypothetical protein GOBAR_AA09676 [Gossypium barbadense]|uniref:Uncharacterized protein n=1 Tax=Gossypium barbadense TaxID=3634 RepID=A0A2P5Y5W1_GOSBA|nr:hypothetical protein GOBAR_AA09676 [Gossypium barbadense]
MSTEPTSIEGSVTPPTSIDSENSGVGASSQANVHPLKTPSVGGAGFLLERMKELGYWLLQALPTHHLHQNSFGARRDVELDAMAVSSFVQHMVKYDHGLEKFLTGEVTVPSAKVRNSEGELVENEAYERYIQQDCALASRLLLLGNSLSEIEYVATILNGLPVEYDPFIAVIAASREPVSLEGVCSILVDAERRNLILQDLVVDHTQNANFVERWDILLIDASIAVPVFLDNVLPSYGSSITMSADRSVLGPFVLSSTAQAIQLDPSVSATWFVDSEATHHVTNESQAFSAG